MKKLPSLNALRVFATVAAVKSFKLAARDLGVTQSAISRQIQALEEQLGMRLIQRDNRVHSLTPAGELLAPELQRMFAQLEDLIEKAVSSDAADARLLKVGISNELLRWWLGSRLEQFYSIYPHLQVEFVAVPEYSSPTHNDELREQLTSDTLDAILIFGQIGSTRHLQSHSMLDSSFYKAHVANPGRQLNYVVQHSPVQLSAAKPVSNTSMALDLIALGGGDLMLPAPYVQGVKRQFGSKIVVDTESSFAEGAALKLHTARHKEHELAVVAFVNWLQHSAASDSSGA